MGYYTQGNDRTKINYNQYAQGKYSFNNKKVPGFENITAIHKMHSIIKISDIYQKSPPLPFNDIKYFQGEYAF